MSEISMYEAQKKKMQGLCDEHDLVYRFEKDRYPIAGRSFHVFTCCAFHTAISTICCANFGLFCQVRDG